MSLLRIAWRSIQQRALASALTAVSMGFGVALVVAVLVIYAVVYQSFHRGGEGYDLIVGKRGSPLQLVLNSAYYLGEPVGNIPYEQYKSLTPEGQYGVDVELAVPICMGHSYEGYPVVATTPDMFKLRYLGDRQYQFADREGLESFTWENPRDAIVGSTVAREQGWDVGLLFSVGPEFQGELDRGVISPALRREFQNQGISLSENASVSTEDHQGRWSIVDQDRLYEAIREGSKLSILRIEEFQPIHGVVGSGGKPHEEEFKVVGVLAPTGTPNDRALFISIKGFRALHAHHSQQEDAEAPAADHPEEVTAVLVCIDQRQPGRARVVAYQINKSSDVQAVFPSRVIAGLFENIVGNIQKVLLLLAVMIVVVAGMGIMVSIYNSMSERRHEIAVMRALGARRFTVMTVILLESILLSLAGGALGLLLGHGLIWALSPKIAEHTGVVVGPLHFQTIELVLIPGLIGLASLVGFLPAVDAYRTDVARSLTATP